MDLMLAYAKRQTRVEFHVARKRGHPRKVSKQGGKKKELHVNVSDYLEEPLLGGAKLVRCYTF